MVLPSAAALRLSSGTVKLKGDEGDVSDAAVSGDVAEPLAAGGAEGQRTAVIVLGSFKMPSSSRSCSGRPRMSSVALSMVTPRIEPVLLTRPHSPLATQTTTRSVSGSRCNVASGQRHTGL